MPDQDIINTEFPGNSRRARPDQKDEGTTQGRKMEKVTTGLVTRKKKSIVDKFSETFFGDDAHSVGAYILWDVLIPAAKNTISEMVSTGIEMLLFGEAKSSSLRRDKGRSYVSYSSMYKDRDRDRGRDRDDRQPSQRSRTTHRFDDIVLKTKGEAEEVLSQLVDSIQDYDSATVADFYDLVGITTEYSDNKYGWYNLNRAYVNRIREGYVIVLPKPIPLD